jgi:hypothetical protein
VSTLLPISQFFDSPYIRASGEEKTNSLGMIISDHEEFSTDGIIAETLEQPLQTRNSKGGNRLSSLRPSSRQYKTEALYNINLLTLDKLNLTVCCCYSET